MIYILTQFLTRTQQQAEQKDHGQISVLRATANVLGIAIFIVPFHPETAATLPGIYTRIDGGIFLRREEE